MQQSMKNSRNKQQGIIASSTTINGYQVCRHMSKTIVKLTCHYVKIQSVGRWFIKSHSIVCAIHYKIISIMCNSIVSDFEAVHRLPTHTGLVNLPVGYQFAFLDLQVQNTIVFNKSQSRNNPKIFTPINNSANLAMRFVYMFCFTSDFTDLKLIYRSEFGPDSSHRHRQQSHRKNIHQLQNFQ